MPDPHPDVVISRARAMLLAVTCHEGMAAALESACRAWAYAFCEKRDYPPCWDNPMFRRQYTHKVLSVRYNLANAPGLLADIRTRTLRIADFIDMWPWEYWPAKWEAAFEAAAKKRMRLCITPVRDRPDGVLVCSRCKSKKTEYTEMQTRSADEPTTKFCVCHACGARWKFC